MWAITSISNRTKAIIFAFETIPKHRKIRAKKCDCESKFSGVRVWSLDAWLCRTHYTMCARCANACGLMLDARAHGTGRDPLLLLLQSERWRQINLSEIMLDMEFRSHTRSPHDLFNNFRNAYLHTCLYTACACHKAYSMASIRHLCYENDIRRATNTEWNEMQSQPNLVRTWDCMQNVGTRDGGSESDIISHICKINESLLSRVDLNIKIWTFKNKHAAQRECNMRRRKKRYRLQQLTKRRIPAMCRCRVQCVFLRNIRVRDWNTSSLHTP